jgi:hypothetical protein
MANANPEVKGSINNIKEHRLASLMDSKPLVSNHFYYNSETKNFAIEDPALFYFIKHLDWNQLRQECGFRDQNEDFDFEVALSFAGENRALARFISESLTTLDVSNFYDEMFESNFLGTAWSSQFKDIFSRKSKYVVVILDKHHLEKIWPTFEREHFSPRVESHSVIPIFLDDTKFVGISSDIVGIRFEFNPENPDDEWQKRATDQIVLKLIDKLSS